MPQFDDTRIEDQVKALTALVTFIFVATGFVYTSFVGLVEGNPAEACHDHTATEAILRDSYELTLRHMERVSRGLSGAIDTSALHLELQSLFNRVVGIIGSAASMDYGTPNDPEPQG